MTDGDAVDLPIGRSAALPRGYARGEGGAVAARPVWVDLEVLFPPGDAPADLLVPDGLVLTGEVRGLLHHWARAGDGRWIAVVSFRLPFGTGHRSSPGLEVRWAPVGADAVRPGDAPTRAPRPDG